MLYLGCKDLVNIVSYRQRGDPSYQEPPIKGYMKPFKWVEEKLFFDLDSLANAVVELEKIDKNTGTGKNKDEMNHSSEEAQATRAAPGEQQQEQFIGKVKLQKPMSRPYWNLSDVRKQWKYD